MTGRWTQLARTRDSSYNSYSKDLRVALSGTTLHITAAGRLRYARMLGPYVMALICKNGVKVRVRVGIRVRVRVSVSSLDR